MNTPVAEPEVIDCQIVPLQAPLRLATPKFIASLKEVEAEIAKLVVINPATQQAAADLQTRLTKASVWLEETRAKVKAPVLEQARLIDLAAKGPADRIDRAKKLLKNALLAYQIEQEAIARAEQAKRQAELDRLETIRLAEEKKAADEARIKAEAEAKATVKTVKLEEDVPPPKTETEKAIEAVKLAPAVVIPKAAGLSWRVTLIPTVTDIHKLPDMFVEKTAKMQAIGATYATGWRDGMAIPECPGVSFEVRREAITR